jgi:putative ABC transport system substrate-binding protein
MLRRAVLASSLVLGFHAICSSFAADTPQAGKVWRIGFLGTSPPTTLGSERLWDAFRQELRNRGYVEGRNLVIESRFFEGRDERAAAFASELSGLKVDLLVSTSHQGTVALKEATSSIPIVFRIGIDPVETGLVTSFAHPGGNLTGIFQLTADLFGKRFELLRELAPRARRIGVLGQSSERQYEPNVLDMAGKTRFEVAFLVADGPDEIRRVIGSAAAQHLEGFIVGGGTVNNSHRQVIVDAIAATRLPAVYAELPFAEAGGILAYASDPREGYVSLAEYADHVLKGTKPADLPVQQSRTVQLVVNLKAARAQGIAIPQSLLVRADEVIQ